MTPADLERFHKLCGLLGSDQIGERAAAALKCTELLKVHGLTWSDVTLPVSGADVPAQRREAMGSQMRQTTEQMERDAHAAMREFSETLHKGRADRAAKKAAWKERRYGADEDGFETGRK